MEKESALKSPILIDGVNRVVAESPIVKESRATTAKDKKKSLNQHRTKLERTLFYGDISLDSFFFTSNFLALFMTCR